MKDLAEFIVKNLIPEAKFEVSEEEVDNKVNVNIKIEPKSIGLLIGKGGNTIKAILAILKIRAKLTNKLVDINVTELQ
jgi:predicted RNA-binding protein YlqC (UPF0109 family)